MLALPCPSINIRSKGQGRRVKKCKKARRDSRAAPCRSALTPLNDGVSCTLYLALMPSLALIVDSMTACHEETPQQFAHRPLLLLKQVDEVQIL